MKAILLHGKSHGHLLHAVPAHKPDYDNRHGQTYKFIKILIEYPPTALYAFGRPDLSKHKPVLDDWKRLLTPDRLW